MSKILRLRDNSSIYVTNEQAENIYKTLNENPNVRILKIITGQGYQYINPFSITSILPCFGDDYRSDEQLLGEQQRALRAADKKLKTSSVGLIGA